MHRRALTNLRRRWHHVSPDVPCPSSDQLIALAAVLSLDATARIHWSSIVNEGDRIAKELK